MSDANAQVIAEATDPETGAETVLINVDVPASETEAENPPQSEAVAIAEINAEKEVTIAAIHADVEKERIEQVAEAIESDREERDDLTWLKERVETLAENMQGLAETVASLSSAPALTPQPSPEVALIEAAAEITEAEAENATLAEPSLTPVFTPDQTSETLTEISLESADAAPGAEATPEPVAKVKVRRRRI